MSDCTHDSLAACYEAERNAIGSIAHCACCDHQPLLWTTDEEKLNPQWEADCRGCIEDGRCSARRSLHWLWACNAEFAEDDRAIRRQEHAQKEDA